MKDEQLQKQLIKQLKIINFWITFFGTIVVVSLLIVGVLLFKMISFVRSTEQKITDFQTKTSQTLNVKDDICRNNLLKDSSYCKVQ